MVFRFVPPAFEELRVLVSDSGDGIDSQFLHSGREATGTEVEVLEQIAGGIRNRDIAEKLFITEETVKVHIKHIMEKLGAADRTQAPAITVSPGII